MRSLCIGLRKSKLLQQATPAPNDVNSANSETKAPRRTLACTFRPMTLVLAHTMRPEDIKELVQKQPFVPFRIHLVRGRKYDVTHPDMVMVLRSRVVIGVGADPVSGIPDHLDHCSLVLIERIEELQSASAGAET